MGIRYESGRQAQIVNRLTGSNLKYYKRTYNPKRNLIEFYRHNYKKNLQ